MMKQGVRSADVQLWWTLLSDFTQDPNCLVDYLSPDELDRANQFVRSRDRERFIFARAALRNILSKYLDTEPRVIRFQYGLYGKPELVPEFRKVDLLFNLAHSHEMVVCGVSHGRQLGVDVEYLQQIPDLEQIVSTAFSPNEQADWYELEPSQKLQGFYDCWTRKEAYVKARGDGLSLRLQAFDVSFVPAKPAALLATRFDSGEVRHWSLHAFSPANGYVGALAIEGQDVPFAVRHWSWKDSRANAFGIEVQ
jgi:4'-phosphopantetheinyl transferase